MVKLLTFTESETGARDLYYNDVQSETTREVQRLVWDKEYEKIINMETAEILKRIDEVLDFDKLTI